MIYEKTFHEKNIIITGGLGFIGSNLASRLVGLGAKVTLIDSLIPEYGGNLFNVNDIKDKVLINISDVRDEHSMKYLIQNQDYLFNLAGQTSHMDSMEYPEIDLEINCRAQLSILEACRKYNPNIRIVFASTRQIYGKPDYLPVDEKHPVRPVDVNGINKLAGEWYHLLYNNVYGIKSSVLRLTNTIGPRMRIKDARQTFVGIWIRNFIEGSPFDVWGGTQLRDFTYVDDCVEALLLCTSNDNAIGKVYNLGGAEVISLKELADIVVASGGSCNYRIREFPDERKKIDIGDYYSDYSLIEKSLDWKPKIKISEAIIRTVEYYKKYLNYYL